MCGYFKSDAGIHAAEDDCVIVGNVSCFKLKLDRFTGRTEVVGKGVVGDGYTGIAINTKSYESVNHLDPAVRRIIECGKYSEDLSVVPDIFPFFIITPVYGSEEEVQIRFFRMNIYL